MTITSVEKARIEAEENTEEENASCGRGAVALKSEPGIQQTWDNLKRSHGGPVQLLPARQKINPGKAFDLTMPLDQVADGYRAMDERRGIKTLLAHKGRSRRR